MRKAVIPAFVATLTLAAMLHQARAVDPVLTEAPAVSLPEMTGFTSEALSASESELTVLPKDTGIHKRLYRDEDGRSYRVTAVIGGRSKGSVHRPELCLPSQGFQMMHPRDVESAGVSWHVVSLAHRDASRMGFAYTFVNQEGYRTSSHFRRIFRDVWDRSVHGRIDRWVMVTVHASDDDDAALVAFLGKLKGAMAR